jgi:hypothetical protein
LEHGRIVGGNLAMGGIGGRSMGGVLEFVFAEGRKFRRKSINSHGS